MKFTKYAAIAVAAGLFVTGATAQPNNDRVDVPPPTVSSEPTPTTTETKPAGNGRVANRRTATTPEEKKGLDLGGLVPNSGNPTEIASSLSCFWLGLQ